MDEPEGLAVGGEQEGRPNVLTVARPLAQMLAVGLLSVVPRSQNTDARGLTFLRGNKRWDRRYALVADELNMPWGYGDELGYTGWADLVDVHLATADCCDGAGPGKRAFHWVLEGARPLRAPNANSLGRTAWTDLVDHRLDQIARAEKSLIDRSPHGVVREIGAPPKLRTDGEGGTRRDPLWTTDSMGFPVVVWIEHDSGGDTVTVLAGTNGATVLRGETFTVPADAITDRTQVIREACAAYDLRRPSSAP